MVHLCGLLYCVVSRHVECAVFWSLVMRQRVGVVRKEVVAAGVAAGRQVFGVLW